MARKKDLAEGIAEAVTAGKAVADAVSNRKKFLKEKLVEHLKKVAPETNRKFDIFKVCEQQHTRGSFRDFLDGDFKGEDLKNFREILQELKIEKFLFHVGGKYWARLD